MAVFAATAQGATMIAAVRGKQTKAAASIGADRVVATDGPAAIDALPPVDAVADTVGGETVTQLLAKVKPRGVFASFVGVPANAKEHSGVRTVFVSARHDAALAAAGQAERDGGLVLPVGGTFPFADAVAAHAALEDNSVSGKVLSAVQRNN